MKGSVIYTRNILICIWAPQAQRTNSCDRYIPSGSYTFLRLGRFSDTQLVQAYGSLRSYGVGVCSYVVRRQVERSSRDAEQSNSST